VPTSKKCRYCQEEFVPQPGKPGFIDECPECLHKKTAFKPPPDLFARFEALHPERAKHLKSARKSLANLSATETDIEQFLADVIRRTTDLAD
jgi:hypothetical protein